MLLLPSGFCGSKSEYTFYAIFGRFKITFYYYWGAVTGRECAWIRCVLSSKVFAIRGYQRFSFYPSRCSRGFKAHFLINHKPTLIILVFPPVQTAASSPSTFVPSLMLTEGSIISLRRLLNLNYRWSFREPLVACINLEWARLEWEVRYSVELLLSFPRSHTDKSSLAVCGCALFSPGGWCGSSVSSR